VELQSENIVEVTFTIGDIHRWSGVHRDVVRTIAFKTDQGNTYGPYGTGKGTTYTLSIPNCILSYTSGAYGFVVDFLMFSFGCSEARNND
jgi:hypothetical protein